MKKIGIVTMAFRSENYGGILQAYALAHYLKNAGFANEIIRYDYSSPKKEQRVFERWRKASLFEKNQKIFRLLKNMPIDFIIKISNKLNKNNFKKRKTAFETFHQHDMPYSKNIFSWQTIKNCASHYNVFITGSDQVWNEGWINDVFLLRFVPNGKTKLSYAASMAQNELTEMQKEMLQTSLKNFKAVSVREETAVKQLAELNIDAQLVLDPTLLLEKQEWDAICSKCIINEDYIFCYFLGSSHAMRKAASAFAKNKQLKIVTLPHMLGSCRTCDIKFGDENLYDVSPSGFLSLVKHAKYVFTDSFHGCIFSYIYQKQFFAFDRVDKYSFGMTSRLYNIMEIFGTVHRFCDKKEKINSDYMASLPDINYSIVSEKFCKMKKSSEQFLKETVQT